VLRLDPGQMTRLDAHTEPARDAALATYARRRFGEPVKSMPQEHMLQAVKTARRLASEWNIVTEPDVATVLDLVIMYGGDFGAADWAADILCASDRTGGEKADAVRARVRRTVPGF
jgi:hypothetical protein